MPRQPITAQQRGEIEGYLARRYGVQMVSQEPDPGV